MKLTNVIKEVSERCTLDGMDDAIRITIRLPRDLHAALVEQAKQDTRSLNGEIVALLREALRAKERQQA